MKSYYDIIAKTIQYLAENREKQPCLAEISRFVGLSEFHLQRTFSEWVGISPKQFLQYLTKEYAKEKLNQMSVLDSALSAGLSGTSRLHDLMIHWEGVTPGEYKNLGENLTIQYGMSDSPFGPCFIATTSRGICHLSFFDSENEKLNLENSLRIEWPKANMLHDQIAIQTLADVIFRKKLQQQPLKLLLKGTPFQIKVWEALLTLKEGELVPYQHIADTIKIPKAVRATASAIAKNNISYLIPCHRVIRQNGDFGQYRWSPHRKKALIAWEAYRISAKKD
jgi:AraC family transcriptional regulator of adaptative response/methylated-DNA-[protein]-cysteine methyltransferase